jgi:hypothetical protein
MHPKDKAVALVQKMSDQTFLSMAHDYRSLAIECSIVLVDEIMGNQAMVYYASEVDDDELVCCITYWECVKNELILLR